MTPTSTAAARVSGTIKALYERACDLVRHEADCPARGRGDEYCKCDAVPFLNDFEALAAIQPDPEPQPVAWRWRLKGESVWNFDDDLEWAGWESLSQIEYEPLYATPSSAGMVSVEAAAQALLNAQEEYFEGEGGFDALGALDTEALRALAGEGGR